MCCSYKVHFLLQENIHLVVILHIVYTTTEKKNQKNDWEKMYNGLQRLHFLKTCK